MAFSGARSGLIGDDDLRIAAEAMAPGKAAALIIDENTWARPFVAAARRAGGERRDQSILTEEEFAAQKAKSLRT